VPPPPDCNRCPALSRCRKHIVGGRGTPGGLCFVGLAPGEEEDAQGKAFVGPSGQLLRLLCEMAGISPQTVYLVNAIRCHPPGNRRPTVAEIRACRPYLLEELQTVKPAIIVTLGDVALQSIYGQTVTLSSVLGQTLTQPETGIPFCPSYHPAFLLRGQWHVADIVQAHFEKALRIASGELGQPRLGDYSAVTTLAQLSNLRDYLLHADTKEIAFDTETTGLDFRHDELLCISFSTEPGEGFVVPLLSHQRVVPDVVEISPGIAKNLLAEKRPPKTTAEIRFMSTRPTGPPYLVEVPKSEVDSHWEDDEWPQVIAILKEIFGSNKKKVGQNCFAPGTRVLTEDLRWVPLADIKIGDRLLAFEENPRGQGHGRCYRPAVVLAKQEREADALEISFSDGSYIITTPEHPFLVGGGRGIRHHWTCPAQWVKRYPRLARLMDTWPNPTNDDNWLAGFLDADGGMSDQPQILLGQLPGDLAERYKDELSRRGYTYHTRISERLGHRPFEQIATHGSLGDILHFLGTVRSQKLIGHFIRFLNGGRNWELRPKATAITGIQPVGRRRVVNIQTDTGTFIAEGFAVHNCIFDLRFLERRGDWPFVTAATAFGIEIKGQIEDTMLLHHAVAETAMPPEARKTKRHSLSILTAHYADPPMPYYEAEINAVSSNKRKMAEAPDDILWKYSAGDADAVERVVPVLRAKADAEGTRWASEAIIQPLIRCCWEMEKRGVLVDTDYFEKLCSHYTQRIADAEARLWAIPLPETKAPWNYMYHRNLQHILFEELGLPRSGFKTDGGRGCEACDVGLCFEHDQTGADALVAVRAQVDHPILPILIELKELRKAKGTYLDGKDGHGGLARFIESDNRIRSTYRPGGAETTRLSSADPNMQNQPANVEIPELGTKDAFCRTFTSPEGFGLMTADWSQAEVWGLAYTAGDDGLLKVLTSGQDVHAYIGRAIWPVDPEMTDFEWKEAHPELRRKAKVLVFGIGYGLTDDGIADRLNCSPEDAQEIRARYMRVVASLPVYFSQARRDVIELGHRDNIFGQRRHFPAASLLKAMRRFNDLEALIREGINYPIQSGCSTLHSAAHNLTENAPALKKRQCYPVISVHDSITFEFYWPDHAYAEETARIIKHLWEQTALTLILPDDSRLGWSIPVEVSWGKTWGDPIYKLTARGDILDLRKEEGEDQ